MYKDYLVDVYRNFSLGLQSFLSLITALNPSFKPQTDDIRNSWAFPRSNASKDIVADTVAYDSVAVEPKRERFPDIKCSNSAADALNDADETVVVTSRDEFAPLDAEFSTIATSVIVDGRRNIQCQNGITYASLT